MCIYLFVLSLCHSHPIHWCLSVFSKWMFPCFFSVYTNSCDSVFTHSTFYNDLLKLISIFSLDIVLTCFIAFQLQTHSITFTVFFIVSFCHDCGETVENAQHIAPYHA